MPTTFLAAAIVSTALAVPNHGHDFVTIGDPGNPATDPTMYHPNFPRPLGAAGYEYRLARNETTYTQQLEFLQAYSENREGGEQLRGWGEIAWFGGTRWELNKGSENRPGRMSPRMWMRYCNWLHNDKALTADAFERGAYDTSTFGEDENGDLTDQMTRSPGAKFWIPSIDEWIKGGYWDPNRHGEGEGGYWIYPNSSDDYSVPGLPEEGGETNAGTAINLDIGSYPDVQTPWGLLDYSGGQSEVVERIGSTFYLSMGSNAAGGSPDLGDDLGSIFYSSASASLDGFRVASAVPAPGAGVLFLAGTCAVTRRRRA